MVILAASVCTKHGKAIVSRQFVEMTKNRIESLLVAFPKLIETGTQHTFVETDSVRYVYQPLERLFLVLITTKTSNILEDLETLRLFANVIPEYCKSIDEHEINESVFELIFAFDEIVSFGYRENVNLSQIRTFVEMDSHEEKVYQAVQQSKEREAKNKMREKAKELQKSKLESNRKSFASVGSVSFSFSSMSNNTNFAKSSTPILVTDNQQFDDVYSSSHSKSSNTTATAAQSGMKTPKSIMRLSAKNQEIDSFVDQVKTEDVKSVAPSTATSAFHVKIKITEKIVLKMSRDGGLEQFELSGQMALHIAQEEFGRLQVHANLIGGSGCGGSDEQSRSNYQIQTHPNVDRELFQQSAIIGLKHATRSFPVNSEVSVLKWRLNQQSNSSDLVPLLINCWTTDNDDLSCDVILEYNLNWTKMELRNVEITFQLPENSKSAVSNCEVGVYEVLRKTAFVWKIDTISSGENSTSSLELSVTRCRGNDLFPVNISFECDQLYTTINVTKAIRLDDPSAAPVRFDLQTEFTAAKYEVV